MNHLGDANRSPVLPLFCLFLLGLICPVSAGTPAPPGDPAAGQTLAEKIRSSMPSENSVIHGSLIIDSKSAHREIPIVCQVSLHDQTWETTYQAAATAQTGAEKLVIVHSSQGPNQYLHARASAATAALPEPAPIPAADTSMPFAGSDFSLGDLALEFLHWPGQSELRGEMRLGQPCFVLESTNTAPDGIVRVKSWIDRNSYGPLVAEAYDGKGAKIKEFSLHGSSFKKVNGQWRLEKMEIVNKKTGSHTVLKFDVPKDP